MRRATCALVQVTQAPSRTLSGISSCSHLVEVSNGSAQSRSRLDAGRDRIPDVVDGTGGRSGTASRRAHRTRSERGGEDPVSVIAGQLNLSMLLVLHLAK